MQIIGSGRCALAAILISFALRLGAAEQTNLLDFEHLAPTPPFGERNVGQLLWEGEMVLSTGIRSGDYSPFYALIPWNSTNTVIRNQNFSGAPDRFTVLARTNGAPFDFLGVDFLGHSFPFTLTVLGYRGLDVVASNSMALSVGLLSFRPNTFTNVTEVRWSVGDIYEFDNVAVAWNTDLPAAIPGIKFRHWIFDDVFLSGLQVNQSYAVEESVTLTNWNQAAVFNASSTIYDVGFRFFPLYPQPTNRFFRVKKL